MKSAAIPIRVLTHNIRYATSSPFLGERPWAERKQLLVNEFEYETRHCGESFICLQEVLHSQLGDVLAGLNQDTEAKAPEWEYIGVGRNDGHEAGEYSPIFYRPSFWELLHWETVWLSKTPKIPSKSWDASSIRIVTIGVFNHRASGNTILAMNTHLDDQGSRSRLEAARIIAGKISEYGQNKFAKLISGTFLAGDFNSEENQEAYQELTKSLLDAYKEVKSSRRYGNHITWTGFGHDKEPASRIDYVLVRPAGTQGQKLKVIGYAALGNQFDDGVLCSDHRAVVVDLALSK
jgi:endonuclease/exonuclease/phosphatase family metal-dependent hydrolase